MMMFNICLLIAALHSAPILVPDAQYSISRPAEHRNTLLFWSSVAAAGAAVADVETTFHALSKPGTEEANPLFRPFTKHRAAAYGLKAAFLIPSIWFAHRTRREWFPLIIAGVWGASAIWNLHF